MNREPASVPPPVSSQPTSGDNHDGLAAVAIVIVAIGLIAFLISQIL